jgi:Right handed beta helix region
MLLPVLTLRTLMIALSLVACLAIHPAASLGQTTHVVNLDGSGDFTSIHDALDAAVAGDTIHLMPGRYTQMRQFQFPAFPVQALAGVSLNNITIRGESRDAVIIGPTVPNIIGQGPIGIATDLNASGLRVESLTIENLFCGVTMLSQTTLDRVTLRGCTSGASSFSSGAIAIVKSGFYANDRGLDLIDPSTQIDIETSVFFGNRKGVDVASARGVQIRSCTIRGGSTGIQVEQLGEALISDCTIEGVSIVALDVSSGSVVRCDSSSLSGGQYSVIAGGSSDLTISNSVIGGGTDVTILANGPDRMNVNRCELGAAGPLVISVVPGLPAFIADFTNNFWFTTSKAQIAAWIHDGNDDPLINTIIQFEPIASSPVAIEPVSWGTLKSSYK